MLITTMYYNAIFIVDIIINYPYPHFRKQKRFVGVSLIVLPSAVRCSTVRVRPASRFHSTDLPPLCAVKWTLPTRSAAPLYFSTTLMRYCVTGWEGGLCFRYLPARVISDAIFDVDRQIKVWLVFPCEVIRIFLRVLKCVCE